MTPRKLSTLADAYRPAERERMEFAPVELPPPSPRLLTDDHKAIFTKRQQRSDLVDGLHRSPNRGYWR